MATVVPTDAELATITAAEIVALWRAAMVDGLGPGATFAAEILDLDGEQAKKLKLTAQAEINRRKSLSPPKSFDRAAFNASIRVARDTGAICRIMVEPTKDKVVTLDIFQKVRLLTKSHPSCPDVPDGAGPFC
jgi:hypothetical protein